MAERPRPLAIAATFAALFLGGGAIGFALARGLAPDSWIADAASVFALPVAFAVSLQLWYGLAIIGLVPRLLAMLAGRRPPRAADTRMQLPGSWVFLPMSIGCAAAAGFVCGLASPLPFLLVFAIYVTVGTIYGIVAWTSARRGLLLPPETA